MLANTLQHAMNLGGHMLTDSKGRDDEDAYTFAPGAVVPARGTLVLCKGGAGSFAFGIGKDDTVTLWNAAGDAVDTTELGGKGKYDAVWTRSSAGQQWGYAEPHAAITTTAAAGPAAGPAPDPLLPLQLVAIAAKGSAAHCDGEDWVMLTNTLQHAMDLGGHMLTDSKGRDDEDAYTFDAGAMIAARGSVVLCRGEGASGDVSASRRVVAKPFRFGIGKDDTITLWDPGANAVDTTALSGSANEYGVVWMRHDQEWLYVSPPPPVCEDASACCAGGAMNGVREAGEQCDTGQPNDACLPNCVRPAAGFYADGTVPQVTVTLAQKDWDHLGQCSDKEQARIKPRVPQCDYHDAVCTISYSGFEADKVPCVVRRKGGYVTHVHVPNDMHASMATHATAVNPRPSCALAKAVPASMQPAST